MGEGDDFLANAYIDPAKKRQSRFHIKQWQHQFLSLQIMMQ